MKKIGFSFLFKLLICCLPGIQLGQGLNYFPKSTPEQEGISSLAIVRFIDSAEKKLNAMHSYMILRHGKLISQGWWAPYKPELPHVMHSLSKSFTSTAIGMAIAEGKLSLNDQVISFFPEYVPADPGWNLPAMRIRDLLTMNTGHIQEPMVWSQDSAWVRFFIQSTVDLKPGTHFKYNSAATYVLSAILQKVTGEKLVDYLDQRLFQPMGIPKPHWDDSPDGINTGGWGLQIRTEDIAKLGQLYLQKGKWEGRQLISEEWVEMATARQTSNGSNPDNDWEQGYGFQFWRCRHNCYRGDGAMGQFCIVIPEHDAVIAITSGVYDMGAVMQLVWDILLPEMKAEPLPKSYKAQTILESKSNHLKLPVIKPILGIREFEKSFAIDDNAEGVDSIHFQFSKRITTIQIQMEHGTEEIKAGRHQYYQAEMKEALPYTKGLPKTIASQGVWVDENTFKLRIYLVKSPDQINYTFRFSEDGLEWESKLEHSLFGPREPAVLVGH